jgi:hypothetical protein
MTTPELNFDPVEETPPAAPPPVVLIMPDPVTVDDETASRAFFKKLSAEQREEWKARYEYLLKAEAGQIPAKVNPLTSKPIEYTKAEWMVPAWEAGLRLLNQVIKEGHV